MCPESTQWEVTGLGTQEFKALNGAIPRLLEQEALRLMTEERGAEMGVTCSWWGAREELVRRLSERPVGGALSQGGRTWVLGARADQ